MKTIVHIGQHKTGTTSIQHYLRENRDELTKQGLYVPDSVAGYANESHYILSVCALNKHRSSPMKDAMLKAKSNDFINELEIKLATDIAHHYENAIQQGCKEIIWSNEGLYLLNSLTEYEKLRSLFDGYSSSVTCVCCFRDQVSYSKSYKLQLQQSGISYSEDKDSYRYVKDDSWLYDYKRKEILVNSVFDDFISFSYEPRDAVKTFMDKLGYKAYNTQSFRLNTTDRN